MKTKSLNKKTELVVDLETTGLNAFKDKVHGLGVCASDLKPLYHLVNEDAPIDTGNWNENFIIAQNGKFDAKFFKTNFNIDLKIDFDTKIGYQIFHIDRSSHLETIVKDIFDVDKKGLIDVYNEATGETRKNLPDDFYKKIPKGMWAKYGKEDVYWEMKLYKYLVDKFKENPRLKKWFEEVEMPLVNILTQSELKGVKIDTTYLRYIMSKFGYTKHELEQKLKWLSDNIDINLNSSKQLQEILYKKFKLPKLKKTATGISTDHKTLEKLAVQHLFPKLLLKLREVTKLLNTFVEPLLERADKDDRIHATYNQCGTKTRRMSCSEPNLQQIPVKTDNGKLIRYVFIPGKGYKFLIADWDQQELRLLAHFSQDPVMLDIYNRQDGDIHAETMKRLGLERTAAKIFNFSLVYGKTPYGLAQDFNCPVNEAEELINKWFSQFKKVKDYILSEQHKVFINKGWTESLAGLPLYCGDPNTNDKREFAHVMRNAVNYPIQASSQDILKKAMVKIGIPFALTVHDELVYELEDDNDLNFYSKDIVKIMEQAWKLSVPLKVSWKIADRWEK